MPGTTPAAVITEPVHFLEEASCESTIFGFRPRNFRETRKSFFATKSRRDAIFCNSHHESATRFSGNPKVFSERSLKRNADFRVRTPLGLYNIKRHWIRENGLPRSVEAPEGASRPCRLSIVPGPAGLTVVGTISVPPRARLCPNFEHCQFPSNFRPGAVRFLSGVPTLRPAPHPTPPHPTPPPAESRFFSKPNKRLSPRQA